MYGQIFSSTTEVERKEWGMGFISKAGYGLNES